MNDDEKAFQDWHRGRRAPLQAAPAGLEARVRARLRPAAPAWPRPRLALGLGLLLLLAGFGGGWWAGHRGGQPVEFRLAAPGAGSVALAASFNGWRPQAMRREGGDWVLTVRVPQGRQAYAFVVNGRRWLPDPDRDEAELAPDGRVHSVLDVPRTRSL